MKIILLILGIFLANVSLLCADGRYWNNLTQESKMTYIVGYRDGNDNGLGIAKFIFKNKTKKESNDVNIQIQRQKVVCENIISIVSGIDNFYSDYANQKLPLPVAVAVVVSRLLGEPENEIQTYIEQNRKEFNQ